MYKTDRTSNVVFSLCYHLISVVKYRSKVFTDDKIISDLKVITEDIAKEFDVEIIEQECGIDHLHLLFRAKPTLNMTGFINSLKGVSSRKIREQYKNFLKGKLWGDSFWSPSYFLATAGNVTIDVLKKNIDDQRGQQE